MHYVKKIFIVTFCFSNLIFTSTTTSEKKSLSQEVDALEKEFKAIIISKNLNKEEKLKNLSFVKIEAKNILASYSGTLKRLLSLISIITTSTCLYKILNINKTNNDLNYLYKMAEEKYKFNPSEEATTKIAAFEKEHGIVYEDMYCFKCENANKFIYLNGKCNNSPSCGVTKLKSLINEELNLNNISLKNYYIIIAISRFLIGYSEYNLYSMNYQKNRLLKMIEEIEILELYLIQNI